MRDALSILSSATVLPSSAAPPGQHRRRNRRSSSSSITTTSNSRNPNSKSKPQFATYPLTSHSRWDNRRSLRYYTYLASKLAEDGRFEDFLMIVESAAALGVEASELLASLNGKSVESGIARLIGEGKLDSVVSMLSICSRNLGIQPVKLLDADAVESLRTECNRLLNCGQLEQLVSLLETLAGFQFPIKELVKPSDVIALCINKMDPTTAIRFAKNCRHAEMLICSIILEFGKKRDLVSALAAFEASKQLSSPNMHVCRTIIDACGLCGDFLTSRAIYEELLAGNATPNVYVLNSFMNVNAHDLNYTLDIYRTMEKLGVTADVTSHNIVLKACCLAGKVELAHDIYKEMRRLESNGALKLDVFTYSTMIKVLANVKMWKLALNIKKDMVSSGIIPNTITWSSLISACANAGLVEEAIKIFNEMLQAGCQPNSQCFNILLHACVEARQFDRAFRLFHCWKESGFQKTMVDEAIAKDQMKVSLRQFPSLISRVPFRPTTSTYNILMKACGSDYCRAKILMDEMKTFGLSPNHMSWSILIDICGGSGNLGGVVQMLNSIREAGIHPDVVTYTTAIKACVEHRNPKLAFMLFAEMKKYHIKPNMVTYNTILRARSRYGSLQEVQQCLAVYQHMRKAGYKPNDYYLKQLIEEWCEGVVQNECQNEVQSASRRYDFGPQSLLLEKVAEHLQQDSNNQCLSIDLRGLTKVEARIVVLAVLRMTKEKYIAGNSIQHDVSITLGLLPQPSPRLSQVGNGVKEASPRLSQVGIGVKEAVIQLLHHDLGVQVHETSCSLPQPSESPTRRPVIPRRLKVTKESLHQWLQRKIGGLPL